MKPLLFPVLIIMGLILSCHPVSAITLEEIRAQGAQGIPGLMNLTANMTANMTAGPAGAANMTMNLTSISNHHFLTNLTSDDHPQYLNLNGRINIQNINGSISDNNSIIVNSNGGNTGINSSIPLSPFFILANSNDGKMISVYANSILRRGIWIGYNTTSEKGIIQTDLNTSGGGSELNLQSLGGTVSIGDSANKIARGRLNIQGDIPTVYSDTGNPTGAGDIILEHHGQSGSNSAGGLEFKMDNYGNGYGWKISSIQSSSSVAGKGDLRFASRENSATFTDRFNIGMNGNISVGSILINSSQFNVQDTVRFAKYGAGTVQFDAGGNITTSSDEKLKTNIQSYSVSKSEINSNLNAVLKTNPITYKYNFASGLDTANTYTGFDAQQLQTSIPNAVFSNPDVIYSTKNINNPDGTQSSIDVVNSLGTNTLSIDLRAIVATEINAIKEQQAIIQAQQANITILQAQVKALQGGKIL